MVTKTAAAKPAIKSTAPTRAEGVAKVVAANAKVATTRSAKAASKECRVCHVTKPLTDFRAKASRPDGRDTLCALCAQAWLADHKAKAATTPTKRDATKQARSVAAATKTAAAKAKRVAPTAAAKPVAAKAAKRSVNPLAAPTMSKREQAARVRDAGIAAFKTGAAK